MTFTNPELQAIIKAHVARTFGIPVANLKGEVFFAMVNNNNLVSASVNVETEGGVPKGVDKDGS